MGTLFIIGNGFDVNCGIDSRYKDVYKGYVRTRSNSESLRQFKKNISADIGKWGDFEMAMAKYAETLGDEAEFLECIRDFAQYMENYLMQQMSIFKKSIENEIIFDAIIREVQNSFGAFYRGISHNVDSMMEKRSAGVLGNISAISFNYTDAFDIVFSECFRRSRFMQSPLVHVHGILEDAPVFGVDNIEQLKMDYALSRKGKRSFIKPIFNTAYDNQRVLQAQKMIENATTICTFGWSLGESDLSWRNMVIDRLRKDKGNHLFVYKYSTSQAAYKTIGEKMDIEDDAKEQLLLEWGISTDDDIFDQIHIPCGRNIFNIKSVMAYEVSKLAENEKKAFEENVKKGKEIANQYLQNLAVV